ARRRICEFGECSPDASTLPLRSTRSAIAASSGPLSLAIAPPKIHGWRFATARSRPSRRTRRFRFDWLKSSIITPMSAPPRMKSFHTQCQEEVYRQVRSYLDELVEEHFDDAEHCDFY